jgi:hypothetical protein
LRKAGIDRRLQGGFERLKVYVMRQTGVAERVEGRDRTADAQHVKTDEQWQRLRPEGEDVFDCEV